MIRVLTLNWNNKSKSFPIFRKDNSSELVRMVLMIYAHGFLFGKLIVTEEREAGTRFFHGAFTLLQF